MAIIYRRPDGHTNCKAPDVGLLPPKLSRKPIVGAAMIMRIDTPVRIFGYPALAMLMLLLAGAGATYLAIQIVRHDRAPKTR